ncbi:class I SAM-dependent methyltransferase [Lacrimispora sp. 38-1]|uniref:class I SAM-dependent methyltransferase n=1 Tax=Lacrimispora sp. 38-1 TaxID=3125778 RepID=UPI003CF3C3CE
MTAARIVETNEGIQSEVTAEIFDEFAKGMRDKGWNGVTEMISSGIHGGDILEIGPGPGYVGLELAKQVNPRTFTGCEISPAMIRIAEKNARDYGIAARYVQGNGMNMPLPDVSFDCVISNGSMHEWENPVEVFNEIYRVLRPGGRYCITDMRRDIGLLKRYMIYFSTKPKEIRPGFLSSLKASYTQKEIQELLGSSKLSGGIVKQDFMGLSITGEKN